MNLALQLLDRGFHFIFGQQRLAARHPVPQPTGQDRGINADALPAQPHPDAHSQSVTAFILLRLQSERGRCLSRGGRWLLGRRLPRRRGWRLRGRWLCRLRGGSSGSVLRRGMAQKHDPRRQERNHECGARFMHRFLLSHCQREMGKPLRIGSWVGLSLENDVIPKARAFTSGPRDLACSAKAIRARSLAPPEKRLRSG